MAFRTEGKCEISSTEWMWQGHALKCLKKVITGFLVFSIWGLLWREALKDLATATFQALEKEPNIEYFDMPENLRNRTVFHPGEDGKFKRSSEFEFMSLEEAVKDYVVKYLK